jgi:L-threonylcarbamoyladenylate synthase
MPGPDQVERAARILSDGGLVAFPTETVYGLGADADNPEAVAKIFVAKGRPSGRPLTLHLGPSAAPERWGHIDDRARACAEKFWPGPLTLVVAKRREAVHDIVTGGLETVGLRVPNHPVAMALLDAFGGAVAAPSANRTGGLSPTSASHVREDLGARVDKILDGGTCPVGIESTVLSLAGPSPVLLRLGAVPRRAIEDLLGPVEVLGQSAPHYRPKTPLRIGIPPEHGDVGVVSFRDPPADFSGTWLRGPADPQSYARVLYEMLRTLDAAGHSHLVVEPVPDDPAWESVASRLADASNTG